MAVKSSAKYSLNKEDGKKILVGLGIAVGGAVLTYLAELIPNVDFGVWTPAIVAMFAVLINTARKYLAGKEQDPATI